MLLQHFEHKNSNAQKEHGSHNSHPHQQHVIFPIFHINIHKKHIEQDKNVNDLNNGKITCSHWEKGKLPSKIFCVYFIIFKTGLVSNAQT